MDAPTPIRFDVPRSPGCAAVAAVLQGVLGLIMCGGAVFLAVDNKLLFAGVAVAMALVFGVLALVTVRIGFMRRSLLADAGGVHLRVGARRIQLAWEDVKFEGRDSRIPPNAGSNYTLVINVGKYAHYLPIGRGISPSTHQLYRGTRDALVDDLVAMQKEQVAGEGAS